MRVLSPQIISSLLVHAASGLALVGDELFCVADDEVFLLRLSLRGDLLSRIPLREGTLPEEKKARKKIKPDFESLFLLDEKIYVTPSGSKANRRQGHVYDLKTSHVSPWDLSGFYSWLEGVLPELNIEGSMAMAEELIFFHRGNGKASGPALIRIKQNELISHHYPSATIQPFDLGKVEGQKLGFTDCSSGPGGIWYLAVVEAGESTYEDGKLLGARLGNIETNEMYSLDMSSKPEGLAWHEEHKCFYLVTDDDDRSKYSQLLKVSL